MATTTTPAIKDTSQLVINPIPSKLSDTLTDSWLDYPDVVFSPEGEAQSFTGLPMRGYLDDQSANSNYFPGTTTPTSSLGLNDQQLYALVNRMPEDQRSYFLSRLGALGQGVTNYQDSINKTRSNILNDPNLLQYESAMRRRAQPHHQEVVRQDVQDQFDTVASAIASMRLVNQARAARSGGGGGGYTASMDDLNTSRAVGNFANIETARDIANRQAIADAEKSLAEIAKYRGGVWSQFPEQALNPADLNALWQAPLDAEQSMAILDRIDRELDLYDEELGLAREANDAYIDSLNPSATDYGAMVLDILLGLPGSGIPKVFGGG